MLAKLKDQRLLNCSSMALSTFTLYGFFLKHKPHLLRITLSNQHSSCRVTPYTFSHDSHPLSPQPPRPLPALALSPPYTHCSPRFYCSCFPSTMPSLLPPVGAHNIKSIWFYVMLNKYCSSKEVLNVSVWFVTEILLSALR